MPGERVIGSYTLDDVKEYTPVNLPATSEVYLSAFLQLFSKTFFILK